MLFCCRFVVWCCRCGWDQCMAHHPRALPLPLTLTRTRCPPQLQPQVPLLLHSTSWRDHLVLPSQPQSESWPFYFESLFFSLIAPWSYCYKAITNCSHPCNNYSASVQHSLKLISLEIYILCDHSTFSYLSFHSISLPSSRFPSLFFLRSRLRRGFCAIWSFQSSAEKNPLISQG